MRDGDQPSLQKPNIPDAGPGLVKLVHHLGLQVEAPDTEKQRIKSGEVTGTPSSQRLHNIAAVTTCLLRTQVCWCIRPPFGTSLRALMMQCLSRSSPPESPLCRKEFPQQTRALRKGLLWELGVQQRSSHSLTDRRGFSAYQLGDTRNDCTSTVACADTCLPPAHLEFWYTLGRGYLNP